jgi:prolipoprotein diacylglyceryltransferase
MNELMTGAFGALTIFFIFIYMLLFLCSIFAFIVWILMLVDAATRTFPGENDKLMWILIIVLVGFIGAVVYYFVVKRSAINNNPEMKKTRTPKI